MVKFERLSGLWNYRLSRPTCTFFTFFSKSKKNMTFTFFWVASHVFSNTADNAVQTYRARREHHGTAAGPAQRHRLPTTLTFHRRAPASTTPTWRPTPASSAQTETGSRAAAATTEPPCRRGARSTPRGRRADDASCSTTAGRACVDVRRLGRRARSCAVTTPDSL